MMASFTARDIVNFWFSEEVKPLWFNSTEEFDNSLRETYLELLEKAALGELDDWKQTAEGCVALCIVLDQFPLNIFRGHARSFETEAMARDVAAYAIEQEFDQGLPSIQKAFLYLPYMHSEDLQDQNKSVELFEKAGMGENLRYAKHHRDIIKRFGRFPHRNKPLGRVSSKEEIEYLNSPESFHG